MAKLILPKCPVCGRRAKLLNCFDRGHVFCQCEKDDIIGEIKNGHFKPAHNLTGPCALTPEAAIAAFHKTFCKKGK